MENATKEVRRFPPEAKWLRRQVRGGTTPWHEKWKDLFRWELAWWDVVPAEGQNALEAYPLSHCVDSGATSRTDLVGRNKSTLLDFGNKARSSDTT